MFDSMYGLEDFCHVCGEGEDNELDETSLRLSQKKGWVEVDEKSGLKDLGPLFVCPSCGQSYHRKCVPGGVCCSESLT